MNHRSLILRFAGLSAGIGILASPMTVVAADSPMPIASLGRMSAALASFMSLAPPVNLTAPSDRLAEVEAVAEDGQQDPDSPDSNAGDLNGHDANRHDLNGHDANGRDAGRRSADRYDADRHDDDRRDVELEAKLEAARRELERAAHEVALLSTQLSRSVLQRFMVFDDEGARRAIIGVQLDAQSRDGARIRDVSPGGPAAEAGLQRGDVIVAIDGKDVTGEGAARQVVEVLRDVAPDSKVKVRVRRDGKLRDLLITARARPDAPVISKLPNLPDLPRDLPRDSFLGPWMHGRGPWADMELATLTPQLGSYFGADKGVLVVRAPKEPGFPLQDGDVILAIDGREPSSGSHATRILSSYQPGEKVSLRLLRKHKTLNVDTTMPGKAPGERKSRAARRDEPLRLALRTE